MSWLNDRENNQEQKRQTQENFKKSLTILLSLSNRLAKLPYNRHGYLFRYEMNTQYEGKGSYNGSEYKKRDGNDASWRDEYKFLIIQNIDGVASLKLVSEDRGIWVPDYYDSDKSPSRQEFKHTPSVMYHVNCSFVRLQSFSEADWLVLLGWCTGENSLDEAKRIK